MTPTNAQQAVQDVLIGTFIGISFITRWVQTRLSTNRHYRYPKRGRRGVR